MPCFALTLGVCFCPMIIAAQQMAGRVNADCTALAIVQQLNARGITMVWSPNTDWSSGGMTFQISPQTPQVQAVQEPPQQLSVTVPEGMEAGQLLQITVANGAPMQVAIPAGVSAGMTFLVAAPAPASNIPIVQGAAVVPVQQSIQR